MFIMLIILSAIVFLICCSYLVLLKCFSNTDCVNGQIYKYHDNFFATNQPNRCLTRSWTYYIKYYVNNKCYTRKIYDSSPTQYRRIGDYINIRYLKRFPKLTLRHSTFKFMQSYKKAIITMLILSLLSLIGFVFLI